MVGALGSSSQALGRVLAHTNARTLCPFEYGPTQYATCSQTLALSDYAGSDLARV